MSTAWEILSEAKLNHERADLARKHAAALRAEGRYRLELKIESTPITDPGERRCVIDALGEYADRLDTEADALEARVTVRGEA